MSDGVEVARKGLREALADVLPLDGQDGRLDEVLAGIEDLIDEKIEALERNRTPSIPLTLTGSSL
jgi:hypothetical protein